MTSTINQRFAKILDEKKISQTELGTKLGRKKQVINNWYRGESPIPVKEIAAFLLIHRDIDARWFITGEYSEEEKRMIQVNETGYNEPDKDHIILLQTDMIKMLKQEICRIKKEKSDKE